MERIFSDHEIFDQIKDSSRKSYIRAWKDFKEFNPTLNYEEVPPGEDAFITFFRHLRLEKMFASSSMWTTYSYINSVVKRKYGFKLQSLPRVTMLLKSFDEDTKNKAAIFEEESLKQRMWTRSTLEWRWPTSSSRQTRLPCWRRTLTST